MKNKDLRWGMAQNYEKKWWADNKNSFSGNYYLNSADAIDNYCNKYVPINNTTNILEIGSGACGIITYLKKSDHRFAIDPLEHFYSTIPKFCDSRDSMVQYFDAKGEDLPFEKSFFDLIIMDNVLDHCEDPQKVMSELKRVLRPQGFVYFRQNTYNYYGKFVRKLMELFLIDKGHPYTFSKTDLKNTFSSYQFKILESERNGYFYAWKAELLSKSVKDKIKAALFVTRDKTTYFFTNSFDI